MHKSTCKVAAAFRCYRLVFPARQAASDNDKSDNAERPRDSFESHGLSIDTKRIRSEDLFLLGTFYSAQTSSSVGTFLPGIT